MPYILYIILKIYHIGYNYISIFKEKYSHVPKCWESLNWKIKHRYDIMSQTSRHPHSRLPHATCVLGLVRLRVAPGFAMPAPLTGSLHQHLLVWKPSLVKVSLKCHLLHKGLSCFQVKFVFLFSLLR